MSSLRPREPISARNEPGTSTSTSSDVSTLRPSTPAPLASPPPIPPKSPQRKPCPSNPSPSTPARSLSLKSKSIAELSPTTAYSKSKSLPSPRKEFPGRFNPFTALIGGFIDRAKQASTSIQQEPEIEQPQPSAEADGEAETETRHIGVDLPKPLGYPLSEEVHEKLEEVEYKVHDILVKHDWAVKSLKDREREEESEEDSGRFERSKTPSPEIGRVYLQEEPVQRGKACAQLPLLEDTESSDTVIEEAAGHTIRIVTKELDQIGTESSDDTSSASPSCSSPNFAKSCPRIRRDEDLKDYSRRLSTSKPSNLDGADDTEQPPDPTDEDMNNFSNFDAGMNAGRQAPPQPGAGPQMNGGGAVNGVQQWPNVGAQSDMNVLWEYIVKLSDMHEQIRAQTQSVASGMQQIEGMRSGSNGVTSGMHINGAVNGLPPPPTTTTESAEIARLQTDVLAAQSKIEDLTAYISTLQTLNTDYENAISHTLDRLRPFAQSHAQALLAQKAHYLHLLEQERSANLELRLEQSRWQEKASEVKEMMVEALKAQSEMEVGYVRKIAGLKADNRSLRRICGVPLGVDSDEEEDRDKNGVHTLERPEGVREGARQMPVRREGEEDGGEGGGERMSKRFVIS